MNVALTFIARTRYGVCRAQEIESIRVVVWLLKEVQIRKCSAHIFLNVCNHVVVFKVRVPLAVLFTREGLMTRVKTVTYKGVAELNVTYVVINLLRLGS